jgi:DNA-binding MarR family transcriptional regulator
MNDRQQKLEDLIKSFQTFRKAVAFKDGSTKMPRITPSQWMALRVISLHGMCTVKDVSQSLNMTSSAATQLVGGLIKSRYVMSRVDKMDRRKVTLTLSAKSTQHIERIKRHVLQQMYGVFKVLNDQEFRQLYRLNKKIADSLVHK